MSRKEQINQSYAAKCAAIGDIEYKMTLLKLDKENILKDLSKMDQELRQIIEEEKQQKGETKHGPN